MRSATSFRTLGIGFVLIATGLATCLAAAPAEAADLTLRFQGQATSSDGDALGLGDDFGTSAGAYLGLEWPLNERLGIEAGLQWMELEQSGRLDGIFVIVDTTASLTVTPLTVALNVHLTPKARYDFYLAPRIGWAFFDDLEIRNEVDLSDFPFPGFPGIPGFPSLPTFPTFPDLPAQTTRLAVEDQFVYGFRLGFDAPFGDSAWSFTSSLDLLGVDLELESVPSGFDVGLDPISIGVGFGYRF